MAQQFCPNCGYALVPARSSKLRRIGSLVAGSWRRVERREINSTALTPWRSPEPAPGYGNIPAFTEAERLRPARPQNAESDVMVPLLQALGTGFFVTLAAGVYAYHQRGFTWDAAVTIGVVAAGGYWLIVTSANRKLLWIVERIINKDIDGETGPPPPPPQVALEVIHKSEDDAGRRTFRQGLRFDLPAGITESHLLEFARGAVQENRGLAEATWTGAGKPFSKPKFGELLDALTRAGIVRWRNEKSPAQGRELTGAGRRALLAFIYLSARTHTHADNGPRNYAFIEGIG